MFDKIKDFLFKEKEDGKKCTDKDTCRNSQALEYSLKRTPLQKVRAEFLRTLNENVFSFRTSLDLLKTLRKFHHEFDHIIQGMNEACEHEETQFARAFRVDLMGEIQNHINIIEAKAFDQPIHECLYRIDIIESNTTLYVEELKVLQSMDDISDEEMHDSLVAAEGVVENIRLLEGSLCLECHDLFKKTHLYDQLDSLEDFLKRMGE